MTDPTFDELASAHLDGATTPAEAARVAADPALLARVEELRRVRDAVAEVPSVDPGRREAAIAAAMAAFADEDAAEDAAEGPSTVPPLATVSARRGPSPRVVRALGAAAVVALLVLLVPILGRLAGSGDEDTASFDSTGAAIEEMPDQVASGAEDHAVTTSVAGTRDGADLGTFDDLASLLASLSSGDLSAGVGTDSALEDSAGVAEACPPAITGDTSATPRESARATVAGDAVVVVVRTERTGLRTLLVYRAHDCALLAERPL